MTNLCYGSSPPVTRGLVVKTILVPVRYGAVIRED